MEAAFALLSTQREACERSSIDLLTKKCRIDKDSTSETKLPRQDTMDAPRLQDQIDLPLDEVPAWVDVNSVSFAVSSFKDSHDTPVITNNRTVTTAYSHKDVVIRFTHLGSSLKHGKLIRIPNTGAAQSLMGHTIIDALRDNGRVDTQRFQPHFFDDAHEGWAKILHNTKIFIPSSGRVDIRLEDTSVVPGAVDHARTLALKSSVKDPGFFGIGVYRLKTDANHGTLWRSAFQFGADFIFTIGARFNKKTSRSTDTAKCWTKVPCFQYKDIDAFTASSPYAAQLIGIEIDPRAEPLHDFVHPARAVYVLGAEDTGLPYHLKRACTRIVRIPTDPQRSASCNVAVSGSIVMFDRLCKRMRAAERELGSEAAPVNTPKE